MEQHSKSRGNNLELATKGTDTGRRAELTTQHMRACSIPAGAAVAAAATAVP